MDYIPNIIVFDLETLPNMNEAMKVFPQLSAYPGLTLKATINTIICAGWKEYGKKKTHCINAWDFKEWKKDINDDKKVVKAIYNVLKHADAVVTHNGKRFDWKFLQTRLMHHKLPPLGKIHHIDTKVECKRHLFAFNNKLNTVGDLLVNEKKLEHTGWNLWVDVSKRDSKAMKLMERYCKQDVRLLEKVFHRLRPLIGNIPNKNIYTDKKCCPICGSLKVKSNGWRATNTALYRRYLCLDCHAWFRTDKRDKMPRTY